VVSLADSTISNSTTFFSSSRNVQRASSGGVEQAKAINRASFSPSKIRGIAGVVRCLRLNAVSNPSSTNWRTRYTIGAFVSNASMIFPSLQPSPSSETSAFNNIRAFNNRFAGLFPLRTISSSRRRSSSP
jgi:hypothetical protein